MLDFKFLIISQFNIAFQNVEGMYNVISRIWREGFGLNYGAGMY